MSDSFYNSSDKNFSSLQVNSPTLDPSAIMEIKSTSKGVLLPRMTTAERDLIPSPAFGLIIDNNDTQTLNIFEPSGWRQISSVINSTETSFINLPYNITVDNYKAFQIGQNSSDSITGITNLEFTNISDILLVYFTEVGADGAGKSIDLTSSYARAGTDKNTFNEADTINITLAPTNQINQYSVSSVFSQILAQGGEWKIGLNIKHNNVGGNVDYLFLKILYTR